MDAVREQGQPAIKAATAHDARNRRDIALSLQNE